MRRRRLLGTVGVIVALSGCVRGIPEDDQSSDTGEQSGEDPDPDTVRDHFDGEPDRPECTLDSEPDTQSDGSTPMYETAETIPYPDPPTEYTTDTLVEYVEAFEQSYITHNVLCDRGEHGDVLRIANSIEDREIFDWYDDITIVYLQRYAGATHGINEEGAEWQASYSKTVACYAIDETGVARVQTEHYPSDEYGSEGPDPLDEGTFIFAFT